MFHMLHFLKNRFTKCNFILIRGIKQARISGHKLAEYYIDNMSEIRADAVNNLLSNNNLIKKQPVSQKELETLLAISFVTIGIKDIFSNVSYKELVKILGYTTSTAKCWSSHLNQSYH